MNDGLMDEWVNGGRDVWTVDRWMNAWMMEGWIYGRWIAHRRVEGIAEATVEEDVSGVGRDTVGISLVGTVGKENLHTDLHSEAQRKRHLHSMGSGEGRGFPRGIAADKVGEVEEWYLAGVEE
jgi:hypothetical protein